MNAVKKVTVDGVEYLPASTLSADADPLAKLLLEAIVSDWYHSLECGKDGGAVSSVCDCTGCQLDRAIVQFLGGRPKSREILDPAFVALWESVA